MAGNDLDKVLSDRGDKYGPFSDHAAITVSLKNDMHAALVRNPQFNKLSNEARAVIQEAVDMICHKLGRIGNGDPFYDDSWRDIAGYARLVEKYITAEHDEQ